MALSEDLLYSLVLPLQMQGSFSPELRRWALLMQSQAHNANLEYSEGIHRPPLSSQVFL